MRAIIYNYVQLFAISLLLNRNERQGREEDGTSMTHRVHVLIGVCMSQ